MTPRPAVRLLQSAVFYAAALLLLVVVRAVFCGVYKPDDVSWSDCLPALWMGLRVDAKWTGILLAPAWVFALFGLWKPVFWRVAKVLGVVGAAVMLIVAVVNFGYYAFYGTPISPIIFGFLQDDTKAIIATIWKDWPVVRYLVVFAAAVLFAPACAWGVGRLCGGQGASALGRRGVITLALAALVMTVALVGFIRGSFGKFPLRQQNYAVSTHVFVNAAVPGGAASLYEAWKGQKALEFKGGAAAALSDMGFRTKQEAEGVLSALRRSEAPLPVSAEKPHVVFAIMESMGRDIFESHHLPENDTLGALAPELEHAVVFRNAISVENGTFPSLEGLLFDTPLTPLTQSRYGRQAFPFSKVLDFKRAGYKVVYLTAGTETWRQVDVNFPLQGFDQVIGAVQLAKDFPEAEVGTWGIGDKWMFKKAEVLLEEADKKGEKLFLLILSATNHPPHRVPDGDETAPVDIKALPAFVDKSDPALIRSMMETYRYSSNALGSFVHDVRTGALGARTIIAATGDHNSRLSYTSPEYLQHMRGVPLLFWLPDAWSAVKTNVDADRWAGHRDLFPTLKGLALGLTPALYEGRNLFAKDDFDLVLSFSSLSSRGFAIGSWGAVELNAEGAFSCLRWEGDRLVGEAVCRPEIKRMGDAARAERALADYTVRSGVLHH